MDTSEIELEIMELTFEDGVINYTPVPLIPLPVNARLSQTEPGLLTHGGPVSLD